MSSECKEYSCDLCGHNQAVEVPHCREYTDGQAIHICVNCGFVYVKYRRSAEDIASSWSDEIFGDGYTARIPAVKARQVYVAETIDTELGLRGKRFGDIGAGEGQFLEIVQSDEYGAKVFGIEPSAQNCDLLKKAGIDFFHGIAEEFRDSNVFEKNKFDIVTIIWTLENSQSCRNMISIAHEMLKPGGHLVVATGSRILVPFKKPMDYYLSTNPADTHCFRFSANTLKSLFSISGFEVSFVNNFIDSDILCIIGEKVQQDQSGELVKDNYLEVYSFFERWHVETQMFYSQYAKNKPTVKA